MAARMPVLGQHHMLETPGQQVDHGHDLVAARNRKTAARTEVVLDVDHQQDIAITDAQFFSHDCRPLACVYRKPKPEHIGDEVRQGSGVN